MALPRYLRWATTHFVLTTDRLIFRSGVLSKLSREIPLERVNDVTFSQSLWERLIGAGDLFIESAGERGQSVFQDIPKPEAVQVEIYRQMEANGQRMSGIAPRAPSVLDELEPSRRPPRPGRRHRRGIRAKEARPPRPSVNSRSTRPRRIDARAVSRRRGR